MSGQRPSSAARGYPAAHRNLRARWARQVATGTVRCTRGPQCKRAINGIAALIEPGEEWDLGHDDRDRSVYTGPEHRACNRATKAHQPPRQRPAEPHPGLTDPGGTPPDASDARPLA